MAQRLGYLGPPGTFGEQAALLIASDVDFVPLDRNAAVVEAVASKTVDEGIAPIENSLEGSVNDTLDALLREEEVFIRGELVLPVEHNLIAEPGTKLEDITVVMSHPQALAQCRVFIERTLPKARLDAALSTSAAVAEAMRTPGAAAIGTRRAAELAGGAILAAGVQDVADNKTRFLILGREDAAPTGDDKTSIAFTTEHDRPGSLMSVLREIADRGLNLTHIESRPSRQELGIYVFLIDFQGHRSEPACADAIEALRRQTSSLRLLGSYPRFVQR